MCQRWIIAVILSWTVPLIYLKGLKNTPLLCTLGVGIEVSGNQATWDLEDYRQEEKHKTPVWRAKVLYWDPCWFSWDRQRWINKSNIVPTKMVKKPIIKTQDTKSTSMCKRLIFFGENSVINESNWIEMIQDFEWSLFP